MSGVNYYYEVRNPQAHWGPFLTESAADRRLEELALIFALDHPFKIWKLKSANNSPVSVKVNGHWCKLGGEK
jgi:hypothetical protein